MPRNKIINANNCISINIPFSKSTFKNYRGVDKVLQNNPDLIAKMMNPKKKVLSL